LQRRLDDLNQRLDSELRAANMRYDDVVHSTDRAFSTVYLIVYLMAGVGSLLGAAFVGMSVLRERRQQKDYKEERAFYEAQMIESGKRQEERHALALEFAEQQHRDYKEQLIESGKRQAEGHALALEFAKQQHKDSKEQRAFYEMQMTESEKRQRESHAFSLGFAQQQLQLGENFLASSNDILAKQIKNMGELGGVIKLVKDTFQMQLDQADKVKTIGEKAQKNEELLANFLRDYEDRYNHVRELTASLKDITRMDWPKLNEDQEATAKDALDTFKSILHVLIKQKERDNPRELADIYQVLGMCAYYGNDDVATAIRYFEEGIRIYEQHDPGPDYKISQGFCLFYMGLIEKNWCRKGREKSVNLESASRNLEKADQILQPIKKDEFLTPVTLAEVLSYSKQERGNAVRQLNKIIPRLQQLKDSSSLNSNQGTLLTRALLIRGNIDKMEGTLEGALAWYTQARNHDGGNPYALLSMAQMTVEEAERRKLFESGLSALREAKTFERRETSAKLLAFAWAVIACHELDATKDQEKYLEKLNAAELSVHPVGGRKPLFFSPVSKGQLLFSELQKEVAEAIAPKKPSGDPQIEKAA
jgi:hypothetical protein